MRLDQNKTLRGLRLHWQGLYERFEVTLLARIKAQGGFTPTKETAYEIRVSEDNPHVVQQLRYRRTQGEAWQYIPYQAVLGSNPAEGRAPANATDQKPLNLAPAPAAPKASDSRSPASSGFWTRAILERYVDQNQAKIRVIWDEDRVAVAIQKKQVVNYNVAQGTMQQHINGRIRAGQPTFRVPVWVRVNDEITQVRGEVQFQQPSEKAGVSRASTPIAAEKPKPPRTMQKDQSFWTKVSGLGPATP